MKNEHLVPVLITDLVEKFNKAKNENEKMNYTMRLEAIREIINETLVPDKKDAIRTMWSQHGRFK